MINTTKYYSVVADFGTHGPVWNTLNAALYELARKSETGKVLVVTRRARETTAQLIHYTKLKWSTA